MGWVWHLIRFGFVGFSTATDWVGIGWVYLHLQSVGDGLYQKGPCRMKIQSTRSLLAKHITYVDIFSLLMPCCGVCLFDAQVESWPAIKPQQAQAQDAFGTIDGMSKVCGYIAVFAQL